jgi:hypothetical protein
MLRWHPVQVAAPEYWLRGGLPFVGHHPGSSSRSAVVRLVSFAGGPCARAKQNVIPAKANMICGNLLLKVPSPFQFRFGGFFHCDGERRDAMAGENHDLLQVVAPGDLAAHCRSAIRCKLTPDYGSDLIICIYNNDTFSVYSTLQKVGKTQFDLVETQSPIGPRLMFPVFACTAG